MVQLRPRMKSSRWSIRLPSGKFKSHWIAIKEDEKTLPALAYGKSKDYNEKQLKSSGKNFIVLRLGSVYGYSFSKYF